MSLFTINNSDFKIATGDACLTCKRFTSCQSPRLKAIGKEDADILIVLPEPTKEDDLEGDLTGRYFSSLKGALSKHGVDINECRIIHSVRCYNSSDLKMDKAIGSCRQYTLEEAESCKPSLIFAVGATALKSLFGDQKMNGIALGDTEMMSGYVIPHRKLNAWVVPLFTPQYVSIKKSEWKPQAEVIWHQDIKRGMDYMKKPILPFIHTTEPKLSLLTDDKEIEWVLDRWLLDKPKLIAFDYEGTGLRPYREGQELVCVSMCDGTTSYAFPLPFSKNAERAYKAIMTDPDIIKLAHNAKFEWMWTKEKFGIDIVNLKYDSCLMAHILCNKRGVTGLKFQTFVHFGVGDYAAESKLYIKGHAEKVKWNDGPNWQKYTHANCFNDMDKFPIMGNLKYCALDSWYTYHLAKIQTKQLKDPEYASPIATQPNFGVDLYTRGSLALAQIERNGIGVDVEYLEKTMQKIKTEVEDVKNALLNEPLIKEWQSWKGDKFNLDSGNQLGKFLYEHKEFKCKSFTDRGGFATDAEALGKLGLSELDSLIHYKKLDKVLNTFLKNFWFERNGDVIHPFFSLNIATSGRSSSQNPNLQNISKHDKEYAPYIRKAIVPHKGQYLAELDYSNLEVYTGCFYHKDPQMIKDLLDPKADKHSETAGMLFLDIKRQSDNHIDLFWELSGDKTMRAGAKQFNFATSYGSYFESTSVSSWEALQHFKMKDGSPYIDYLKSQGISTFLQWKAHVKRVDEGFWNERFQKYGEWRKENYKLYKEQGYFDNYTGFRYKGMLSKNASSNWGIQGSAFNIMLGALTQLQDWLTANNKKSKICGQIHDSMILSLEPDEVKEVVTKAKWFMEEWSRETYKFITIPLRADVDISPTIGGDWTTLDTIGYEDLMEKEW